MAIRNKCPGCRGEYEFEKAETGQVRSCPYCQAVITLTKPESRKPLVESVIVVVALMFFVGYKAAERNRNEAAISAMKEREALAIKSGGSTATASTYQATNKTNKPTANEN